MLRFVHIFQAGIRLFGVEILIHTEIRWVQYNQTEENFPYIFEFVQKGAWFHWHPHTVLFFVPIPKLIQ